MGLRRQEFRLSPEHRRARPALGFGFVESSVENVETVITPDFQARFIGTSRIIASAEKIFDCTIHGR
jgi:hypothetical protein